MSTISENVGWNDGWTSSFSTYSPISSAVTLFPNLTVTSCRSTSTSKRNASPENKFSDLRCRSPQFEIHLCAKQNLPPTRISEVPITIGNLMKKLSVKSCNRPALHPSAANLSRIGMSNYPHAVGNFNGPGCVLLIRWLGGIETPRLNVTRGPHAPPRRRGGMFLRKIYTHLALDIVILCVYAFA